MYTCILILYVAAIPGEDDAMSLAAPAIAIANQSKPVGHTAPLLPTPPTVTSVLGAAGIVPTAPVSWRERERERERETSDEYQAAPV